MKKVKTLKELMSRNKSKRTMAAAASAEETKG
jgi:hypothetical protein